MMLDFFGFGTPGFAYPIFDDEEYGTANGPVYCGVLGTIACTSCDDGWVLGGNAVEFEASWTLDGFPVIPDGLVYEISNLRTGEWLGSGDIEAVAATVRFRVTEVPNGPAQVVVGLRATFGDDEHYQQIIFRVRKRVTFV